MIDFVSIMSKKEMDYVAQIKTSIIICLITNDKANYYDNGCAYEDRCEYFF